MPQLPMNLFVERFTYWSFLSLCRQQQQKQRRNRKYWLWLCAAPCILCIYRNLTSIYKSIWFTISLASIDTPKQQIGQFLLNFPNAFRFISSFSLSLSHTVCVCIQLNFTSFWCFSIICMFNSFENIVSALFFKWKTKTKIVSHNKLTREQFIVQRLTSLLNLPKSNQRQNNKSFFFSC